MQVFLFKYSYQIRKLTWEAKQENNALKSKYLILQHFLYVIVLYL